MVWLDLDDSPEELLKKIADSGHSRFPVARDDLEHVTSVVQTKDLLALSEGKRLPDFETAGHAPLFVPDTMTVLNLLEKMQASAVQMALVSDELGHIEGIVTAADVLGAIAGDVAFSPEDGLARPQKREDGSWLLDGRMAIEDAEIALGLDLTPEDDPPYTTVAGLVIEHLQRIPELGDVVISSGWRFEVIDMDGRRDRQAACRAPSARRGRSDRLGDRDPVAVEARRNAVRDGDRGGGRAGEVLRIEDHEVGRVRVGVDDIADQPAFILGGICVGRDEDELAGHAALRRSHALRGCVRRGRACSRR